MRPAVHTIQGIFGLYTEYKIPFLFSLSVEHLDLCSGVDLPEVEIVSLLAEELPRYTLRADHVFGYEHDDWLHTPLLPPEAALGLTYEQIDETLKYFCKSALSYLLQGLCSQGV